MVPEFHGKTAEEVSEQMGLYVREQIEAGALIEKVVMIVMRTTDGFKAAAGSRDGLLAQVAATDPKYAKELRRTLKPRPGYVPIIALDPIDGTHGVEWIGPFPNSQGGSA